MINEKSIHYKRIDISVQKVRRKKIFVSKIPLETLRLAERGQYRSNIHTDKLGATS